MSSAKIFSLSLTPRERARFEQQQQKFLLRLQAAAVSGQRCIMVCERNGAVLAYADKAGNVQLIAPFCHPSRRSPYAKRITTRASDDTGFHATHEHIYYVAQTGHIYQIHCPDPNQLLIRIPELPADAESMDASDFDLSNPEHRLLFILADTVDAIHS